MSITRWERRIGTQKKNRDRKYGAIARTTRKQEREARQAAAHREMHRLDPLARCNGKCCYDQATAYRMAEICSERTEEDIRPYPCTICETWHIGHWAPYLVSYI
jgi:hypothetical protein